MFTSSSHASLLHRPGHALIPVLATILLLTTGCSGTSDNETGASSASPRRATAPSEPEAPAQGTTTQPASVDEPEVLHLHSPREPETTIDGGTPGFGVGDQLAWRGELLQAGASVGEHAGLCTYTFAGEAYAELICTLTFWIARRGTIAATALREVGVTRFEFAITGGTGDFVDVTGSGWMRTKGNRAPVVLSLRHVTG